MAGFKLVAFRGERPFVSNRLLEDNEAQFARNTKLGSGELRPLKDTVQTALLARPGDNISIYKFGSSAGERWLHWTNDVDVARGPIIGDTTERTYFTGENEPRVTNSSLVDVGGNDEYPESWYKLGVPAPTLAPNVEISATGSQGRVTEPLVKTAGQVQFYTYQPFYTGPQFSSPYTSSIEAIDGTGDVVEFTLPIGTELIVNVIDSDNIELTAASGEPGFGASNFLEGWKVSEGSAATDQPVSAQFRIPNGVSVEVQNHGLRNGDIIRVTSVESPLTWTTTAVLNLNFTAVDNVAPTAGSFTVVGTWTYQVVKRNAEVDLLQRSYVYTWVSILGEESAPSPPSVELSVAPYDVVTISSFGTPPSDDRVVSKVRIYRTSTGSETSEFQFVLEENLPVTTIDDEVLDEALGEVLQTESWDPPPEELLGIIALPNGIFAGFVGNTLYLSEPGYPHAWPPEYRRALDFPIVGLGVFGTALLVATEGTPYVGQGAHPRNYSLRRIEYDQGCVSKRSIKNIGEAVVYASPDGLVLASSAGVRLIEGLFHREEWQTYNPSSIHACSHDGKYIAFYSGGAKGSGALIFDPSNPNVGLTRTDQTFDGSFTDKKTDTMYVTGGTSVRIWEGDSEDAMTMLWRSKLFELDAPTNFGWLTVYADAYPVTIRVYGDETLVDTVVVGSSEPVRLASGRLYGTYYIEIETENVVKKVLIGDEIEDVMEG